MLLNSNRGYTLIQVAMGLGLIALLAVISASVMNMNLAAIRGVSNTQSSTMISLDVRRLLQKKEICSGNFSGRAISLNQPVPIETIDSYNSSGVKGAVAFDSNANDILASVTVEQIRLVPKMQISSSSLIGQVEMTFLSKGKASGSQSMVRQFPVSIKVDASNNLVECGAVGQGGLTEESICSASGGTFDPTTKSCTVIPTGTTADGNLGAHAMKAGQVWHCATAPIGSSSVDCLQHMRPGDPNPEKQPNSPGWTVDGDTEMVTYHGLCVNGQDPGVKNSVSRVYTNGQTMKKNPPPFILRNISGTKADCVWANDLTPADISKMGCGAWCTRFISGP